MRRVVEHLENFDSIRLERTVEDKETSKIELALHIISVNLVNLDKISAVALQRNSSPKRPSYLVRLNVHVLDTQCQNPTSASSVPPIGLLVPLGNLYVHALQSLGCTLNSGNPFSAMSVRDGRDGGHSLESRRKLVSASNMDLRLVRRFLGDGRNLITYQLLSDKRSEKKKKVEREQGDVPLDNFQSKAAKVVFSIGSPTIVPSSSKTRAWAAARARVVSLLLSVTGRRALGSAELLHCQRQARALALKDEFLGSLDTSDTFNNEVFTSNGTGLVETADIHSSSPWDTERLGTEDGFNMYLARGKKG